MPNSTGPVLRLALAASLTACATGQVAPPAPDREFLTSAELAHAQEASLYDAIRRLRPSFLRTRGPSSVMNPTAMGPAVIVDHAVMGGLHELAGIPLGDVQSVRYLASWHATTRHGSGYANGVIEVTTWRGRRPWR